jgi:hypothetical protein
MTTGVLQIDANQLRRIAFGMVAGTRRTSKRDGYHMEIGYRTATAYANPDKKSLWVARNIFRDVRQGFSTCEKQVACPYSTRRPRYAFDQCQLYCTDTPMKLTFCLGS